MMRQLHNVIILAGLIAFAVPLSAQVRPARPTTRPSEPVPPVQMPEQQAAPTTRAPATQPSADEPFIVGQGQAPVPTIRPDELLRLSVVEGMLVLETAMRPGGPQLVHVEGLRTPVSVTVIHRSSDPGQVYAPDSMTITMLSQQKDRIVTTTLLASVARLSFSRDTADATGEYTAQFIQQLATGTEPANVLLFIQALQTPETKKTFTAESFTAFTRLHPAHLNRYVRPMLEAFAPQPQLFMVSDAIGSQVFPEVYGADEATRQRISALIRQLADESFAKRQRAAQELEGLGTAALAELAQVDRARLDPEQATRIDVILAKLRPSFDVDASKLRSDPGFLLDCMMSANPALRKAAWQQLQKATGREIAFGDPSDENERTRQVYALRRQLMPELPATLP